MSGYKFYDVHSESQGCLKGKLVTVVFVFILELLLW